MAWLALMLSDRKRAELERELAKTISSLEGRQSRQLLKILGDPPKLDDVTLELWETMGKEMLGVLTPATINTSLLAAENVVNSIPIGVNWDMVNQRAASWASTHNTRVVREMYGNTNQATRDMVADFYTQGLSVGDLRRRLQGRLGAMHSEMVAVTEVTAAAVEGGRIVADELAAEGVTMIESWVTARDERVCIICAPLDGKVLGDGWTRMDGPPAHIRCRCDTAYKLPPMERAS